MAEILLCLLTTSLSIIGAWLGRWRQVFTFAGNISKIPPPSSPSICKPSASWGIASFARQDVYQFLVADSHCKQTIRKARPNHDRVSADSHFHYRRSCLSYRYRSETEQGTRTRTRVLAIGIGIGFQMRAQRTVAFEACCPTDWASVAFNICFQYLCTYLNMIID